MLDPAADDRAGRAPVARVAFYGRSATADDLHVVLRWQLFAVRKALPSTMRITGYFVDVGGWSGLSPNSIVPNWLSLDGHAIDGGMFELLERTCRDDRVFDVVACEGIDRLSRRNWESVRIEDALAAHGVRIVAADEPVPS